MTDKVLAPKDIRNMTQEEREELAKHMAVPIRCGGADYIDGKLHYRIQGWLVPADVIEQSRQDNNGDPWIGIKAYQETHEPYIITRRRGK